MVLAIVAAVLAIAAIVFVWVRKPARLMISKEKAVEDKPVYEPQFDYAVESVEEEEEESEEGEEQDG